MFKTIGVSRSTRKVALGGLFLILMVPPALGSSVTVTNTDDSGPGSLRDAIATAAPGDTIDFVVTGTITLSSPLAIDKDLTISGPGAANLTVSGNNSVVVFETDFYTNVTISGLTVSGGFNAYPGGWGGGIRNGGSMTVSDCVVTGNTIPAGGGPGGGIFNYSSLRLINSVVSGNSAAYGGGGVWNNGNATLEITDSTISANSTAGDGAGVGNVGGTVTIIRTRISGNTTPNNGGGVANNGLYGTLTVIDSTFSGNSNNGICSGCNTTQYPGSLRTQYLTVTGSTFSGNTSGGFGGGIVSWGTTTITNSTFASNTGYDGGGVYVYTGLTTITNSTFSGNRAIRFGGGLYGGPIVKNTVLADSGAGGNCFVQVAATSAGHNLSDDNSCSSGFIQPGDLNGTPAGLDPAGLQDNGGLTETFALTASSPALDAIPVSECTDVDLLAVTTDQRGASRPQGVACDMGSFEASLNAPPNTSPGTGIDVTPTTTLPDGSSITVSMTFDNVVSGGETTVTTSAAGPPPPAGFKLMSPPVYYEISTTAVFVGDVRVCLNWSEGQINNEANVKVFHNVGGQWVDITDPTSIDTVNNGVCGTASSLSPFTLFEVKYAFGGFLPPVDPEPTANAAKAGSSIPVKFSLGGDQGLDIFAAGYPRSQLMQCVTGNPISEVAETVTAGASGLNYDPQTDRYTYIWKTDSAWANSCRQLQLKLADGETYTARFTFRR